MTCSTCGKEIGPGDAHIKAGGVFWCSPGCQAGKVVPRGERKDQGRNVSKPVGKPSSKRKK